MAKRRCDDALTCTVGATNELSNVHVYSLYIMSTQSLIYVIYKVYSTLTLGVNLAIFAFSGFLVEMKVAKSLFD